MTRHALIDRRVNPARVVNLIELEDGAVWRPPEGHVVVLGDDAHIGDEYRNGTFVRSAEEARPASAVIPTVLDRLAAIEALLIDAGVIERAALDAKLAARGGGAAPRPS